MLYIAISLSSLTAVFLHNLFITKTHQRFSKIWILLETAGFWVLTFGMFYLKSYVNYGYWPGENKTLPTIVTGVAAGVTLGVSAVLIHIFLHQSGNDKYKTKCLFTVKRIPVFPLNSFIYALVGFVIVVTALFVVESAVKNPTLDQWAKEDSKIWAMDKDKNYDHKTDYPLIKVRGTAIEKDAPVKILVLGDSFVFGYGYSNFNYMWWNQLSNVLKIRGYNCDIYGVGYEGASTYSELQWLTTTSMVSDLDPDIIIIGYVTNDPDSSYSKEDVASQYGTLTQVLDLPFKNTITKLWPGVFSIFDNKISEKLGPLGLFNHKIGFQYATWELKQIKGEKLAQYNSQVIKPLGEFEVSSGIPIVLVTTPHMPSINYFEPRYAPVLPLFEKAGIKTYNMLNNFCNTLSDKKYEDNLFINPVDPHPGTAGTWFYSKYIANLLESDYPDILGKKTLTGKEIYNIDVNDWMPYSLSPQTVTGSGTSAKYIISYPDKNSQDSFLTMPANENYVKLNFKYPVDISTVTIEGKKLDSATLYVTGINEDLGFDDQVMHKLGKKSGQTCEWADNNALRVTSLCIHAETSDGTGDNLTVKITCKEGAVSP